MAKTLIFHRKRLQTIILEIKKMKFGLFMYPLGRVCTDGDLQKINRGTRKT